MSRSISGLVGLLGLCAASAGCDGPTQPSEPSKPAPASVISVTAVVPATGAATAETPVTISGSGFRIGATVQFGGAPAVAVVVSSTTITATAPAHAEGVVAVVVTNPGGHSGARYAAYTYQVEPAFAIFGVVTEMTDEGEMPVEGMQITESGTFTSVRTDTNGAYRLDGLRRSTFTVSMIAPGYVDASKSVTASSDTRLDLRVVRFPSFVLSGMVYEATPAGRVPLDDVLLYCDGCGSPFGHTYVRTDANGFYRFEWTYNGKNWIQFAGKEGYRYAGPLEPLGIPVIVNGHTRFDIELVKK